jgi:hypothetical protein
VWDEAQIDDDVRRAFTGGPAAPILAYTSSPALTTPHVPTGAGAALATPVEAAVEVDTMNFVHEPEAAERRSFTTLPPQWAGHLKNGRGVYWTHVANELGVKLMRGELTDIPVEATSPMYCAHSNEAGDRPCKCNEYCYCRVVGNCGKLLVMHKLPPGTAKEISRRVEERRK